MGIDIDFFVRRVEVDLIVVLGPTINWYPCMHRNWLGFSARIAMTAFLVRAENDFFCNFEIDWPGFCVWSKLTWFLHAGRKALGFSVSIEVDLVFVWVVEIGLISIWGIELDLISCEDRNWLSFFVGVEMTLFQYLDGNQPGLRRGIKINLNVEWRSKLTWF